MPIFKKMLELEAGIQIFEEVIFRGNFKISPFKKVMESLLNLKLNDKEECNDLMQELVKLILDSLNGENVQKDFEDEKKT